MDINAFFKAVVKQDAKQLTTFFTDSAYVNWHCTNEHFTVDEYIQANCEYPGKWDGIVERIEAIEKGYVVVGRIFALAEKLSFQVVSFISIKDDKIVALDEYFGDNGEAPQWRLDKKLGTTI